MGGVDTGQGLLPEVPSTSAVLYSLGPLGKWQEEPWQRLPVAGHLSMAPVTHCVSGKTSVVCSPRHGGDGASAHACSL